MGRNHQNSCRVMQDFYNNLRTKQCCFFFCLVLNLFNCFTFQKFNSCKLSSLFIKPSLTLLNANFINKLHNQIKIKGKIKERERKKNIFIQSNDNLDQQSTHYYSWEVGYLHALTFILWDYMLEVTFCKRGTF